MAPVLVAFQPDRPHNLGGIMRLAACLGVPLHVIEPSGFPLDDRRIRQAGLDYIERLVWHRHADFDGFDRWRTDRGHRLVLASTGGIEPHHHVRYTPRDLILVGRESGGVPEVVRARADLVVRIPMAAGVRSHNVVVASALVIGEAMRQTGALDALARAGG